VPALLLGAAAAATVAATRSTDTRARERDEPAATRNSPGLGSRRAERWVRPTFRCRGVKVRPGARTIQHAVDAHRGRTTFCLRGGVYRLTRPIVPKTGDTFVGRPKTVINGSKLLAGWRQSGRGVWYVDGQGENDVTSSGTCTPSAYTGCRDANDVYYDDRALRRVMSRGELGPGRFYFDHARRRIYVGSNPRNHRVEVAVTTFAWQGIGVGAYGVVIKGVTVEKFSTSLQAAAIHGGRGWLVEGVEARLNHAAGLDGATTLRDNYVHDNGQAGLGGSGPMTVDGNEIAWNNYARVCPCWEAGGAKWANGSNVSVTDNDVHDNRGPGLWTDGSESHITIARNRIERNSDAGILVEISYDASVSHNVVRRNGAPGRGWCQAGGIVVAESPRVEVFGNTVSGNRDGICLTQQDRGTDPVRGPHRLQDVYVHDNTVVMTAGHSGLIEYVDDTSYYTSRNNRFQNNTYSLGCGKRPYFIWMRSTSSGYGEMSFARWLAAGQDADGAATRRC
jgi:parallel beta-helix repeat protein